MKAALEAFIKYVRQLLGLCVTHGFVRFSGVELSVGNVQISLAVLLVVGRFDLSNTVRNRVTSNCH